ncbi:hypothetical protein [Stenotrophomonas sp.]|uniref:hypothetical protein n=1 Tax=Stenotrophomonas sp. TaxID=69392 RepID=UPI0028A0B773|nr:hypothetical protein [Stenotrophomonas sp.]
MRNAGEGNKRGNFSAPRQQRGIATLLVVLMVGLAVSVTVAATIYALRGTQSQQLTTHSATAAQAAAWRGVEALRLYLLAVEKPVWPGWVGNTQKPVSGLEALGVSKAVVTAVEATGANQYRVIAEVTGQAGVGSGLTTATVEVVYDVVPGNGMPGVPPVCHSMPNAPVVFNGDVKLDGEGTQVVDDKYDYENIVVSGKLTIGAGGRGKVSGCAKGAITVTGGDIADNGHLHSESQLVIGGMSFPAGARLWAREITFNGGSGGPLARAWAGAYDTVVYANGVAVGEARVGGSLIPSTVSGGVPWTQGTVLPTALARVKVTLTQGKGTPDEVNFLLNLPALDMTKAVDAATGELRGAGAVMEQLSGPEETAFRTAVLSFRARAIHGGGFTQGSGATTDIVDAWGWSLGLGSDNRRYDRVRAAGSLAIQHRGVRIGEFAGGGEIWAQSGNDAGAGFPAVAGRTAGYRYFGGSKQLMNEAMQPTGFEVQGSQGNFSPGLPGLPYCDVRTNYIDADVYRDQSNYIFDANGGKPQLTIRNVTRADGVVIGAASGTVYPLTNPDAAQLKVLEDLFACGSWEGADKGCRAMYNNGRWNLQPQKTPPGIFWFDGPLEVRSANPIVGTLIVRGNLGLSDGGGYKLLEAPNFAGVAKVCSGAYYPTNLCASRTAFVTWEDADGVVYTGAAIGNAAVIASGGLNAQSWTSIRGSVVLGKKITVGGAKVNIEGSLSVGNNEFSQIDIGATGMKVETPQDWKNLGQLPVCSKGSQSLPTTPGTAAVQWSRYL